MMNEILTFEQIMHVLVSNLACDLCTLGYKTDWFLTHLRISLVLCGSSVVNSTHWTIPFAHTVIGCGYYAYLSYSRGDAVHFDWMWIWHIEMGFVVNCYLLHCTLSVDSPSVRYICRWIRLRDSIELDVCSNSSMKFILRVGDTDKNWQHTKHSRRSSHTHNVYPWVWMYPGESI